MQHELGPRAPQWLVLENWQFKASIAWLRARLQEGAIGRVLSAHCAHHHPEHHNSSDSSGGRGEASWRSQPAHEGAWLVDVGVHWARALRVLLGEPSECSAVLTTSDDGSMPRSARGIGETASPPSASGAAHGWLTCEHCASAVTIALSAGRAKCGASAPPSLRIDGESGSLCWWAASENGRARVTLERSAKSGQKNDDGVYSLPIDDDWVEGGVRSCLEHALLHLRSFIDAQNGNVPSSRHHHQPVHHCLLSSDNALRDLQLIWGLLRSHSERRVIALAATTEQPSPVRELWDMSATRSILPSRIVHGATVGEVMESVALAGRLGLVVRPVGFAHSWSGSYGADDHRANGNGNGDTTTKILSLSLVGMDRILSIDTSKRTVTLEPGVTLRELRSVLAAHDLTLGSYPMLLDQTVGGATIGCGAHGSAPRDGTLSDQIISMSLVDCDAKLVNLPSDNAEEDEARLCAARVSLGLLGVVTRLTLQCEPKYYVKRHVHVMSTDEFIERADALCETYRHLWVWWALGERRMCICALEDVGSAPAPGAVRYDGEVWYQGTPPLEAPRAEPKAEEEKKEEEEAPPRWVSMQYAFPRERLGALIKLLSSEDFHQKSSDCLGRVIELKFVGGPGKALLGVNQEGPVVCVNAYWRGGLQAERRRLASLERALNTMGGRRPHLGKLHYLHYPMIKPDAWIKAMDAFEDRKRADDPSARFGRLDNVI